MSPRENEGDRPSSALEQSRGERPHSRESTEKRLRSRAAEAILRLRIPLPDGGEIQLDATARAFSGDVNPTRTQMLKLTIRVVIAIVVLASGLGIYEKFLGF